MPATNYIIGVTVTLDSAVQANLNVTLRNESSNETLTETTDSAGQVAFDCANFDSGFSTGDIVTAFCIYTSYEDSSSLTIPATGGGTTLSLELTSVPSAEALRYTTVQEVLDTFDFDLYDAAKDQGIKSEQIVKIGVGVERDIDKLTGQRYDNSNSFEVYLDGTGINSWKYFVPKYPVQTITAVEVNNLDVDSEADWSGLANESGTIGETMGLIETAVNTTRLDFGQVPSTGTTPTISHGTPNGTFTAFTTVTEKATDSVFTAPAGLGAGTVEWSLATGNLNFSAADVSSYDGQTVRSSYDAGTSTQFKRNDNYVYIVDSIYQVNSIKSVFIRGTYGYSAVPDDITTLANLMIGRKILLTSGARALVRGQDFFFTTALLNQIKEDIDDTIKSYRVDLVGGNT